ncbi:MAG: TRADD-N-associated membrane domain-containing protein [Zhenhengia sp.]|jgi:hypothetical protein|uniref:TRADD-N-associated membrane domain-containing protein n=1 Tax=Zhenhengia sp. TaxID=2944208 RepID=UPI002915712B|nr:hypothetical protein [Clostridiales bacterium]MDU6974894.1 hypothetical protein [Clostridiales bacterium]
MSVSIDMMASVTVALACSSAVIFLINSKEKLDFKISEKERNQVEDAVKTLENYKDGNVIDLMYKNVSELKEYYVISKLQASKSFSSSLIICFLGIVIYCIGIGISVIEGNGILIFSTIAGTIVELIAGLFFWLHKQSLEQLNLYHQRLGTTEKYLTAIQLISKMSPEKQDESYRHLMECIMIDNRYIINATSQENRSE